MSFLSQRSVDVLEHSTLLYTGNCSPLLDSMWLTRSCSAVVIWSLVLPLSLPAATVSKWMRVTPRPKILQATCWKTERTPDSPPRRIRASLSDRKANLGRDFCFSSSSFLQANLCCIKLVLKSTWDPIKNKSYNNFHGQ